MATDLRGELMRQTSCEVLDASLGSHRSVLELVTAFSARTGIEMWLTKSRLLLATAVCETF